VVNPGDNVIKLFFSVNDALGQISWVFVPGEPFSAYFIVLEGYIKVCPLRLAQSLLAEVRLAWEDIHSSLFPLSVNDEE
jgi:hypothetical protein